MKRITVFYPKEQDVAMLIRAMTLLYTHLDLLIQRPYEGPDKEELKRSRLRAKQILMTLKGERATEKDFSEET